MGNIADTKLRNFNNHRTMNKITTFEEYSRAAASTQMESCKNEDYLRFGLMSEVGELCAIFKRAIRGDFKLEDKRADILLELGDICWYLDRYRDWRGANIEIGIIEEHYHYSHYVSELVLEAAQGHTHNAMFNVCHIADYFGFTIWDVLTANVEKLAKRKERGLIMGSGDHR